MVDGYLKIKTKLDNKGIDKDVVELENKIKKLETDNSKTSTEQRGLQEEINQYEQLHQKAEQYKNKIKELKSEKEAVFKANPQIAVAGDTAEYANIKTQIEEMKQKYAETTKEIDKQAPKMEKVYTKLDKVKAKQTENNAKITQYKQKIDQINLKKVQSGIDGVGKGIQSSISKLGKMAMAVVGIRTAFGAVKSAISTVSQYNPQIAADFEYMRYCIANLLAPAIRGLVNLLHTVLSYVNSIASAWFGINLFGNASAKNFEKMKNSAGGTAKSAKEIQKSLQGFDEMNVLQDNSSSDSGGSGGTVAPSMDLSGMQAEVPAWLQWIIDNKELVLGIIAGITAGLIAIRVFGLEPLMGLGIGLIVGGIVALVQDLINFINDPSWSNFLNILRDISVILVGIGIIVGLMTGNWIPLVIGLIALIVVEIMKHWDEICQILRTSRTMDLR